MRIDIEKLASEIKADKKSRQITPRELFNAFNFERRTFRNCEEVDKFLNANSLMVEPHYNDVWIDEMILLKHKPFAKTEIPVDPIRRIKTLDSANTIPLFVNNDASLLEATTIMQSRDFSQLPVLNGSVRNLVGYISWETIAKAKINGVNSDKVKDYMNPNVATLTPDTPLIKAIEIVKKNDFAVVLAKDKSLYGIVTVNDVTEQFIKETDSFVLLSELECHLRNLLRDIILEEDLKKLCVREQGKEVTSIDEMTFGDYVTVFGNEEQWKKLHIAADRKAFLAQLESIRKLRNDVMHFRPSGLSEENKEMLKHFVTYLRELSKYKPCK
jgi:predicted transcriptional regulator